MYAVLHGAVGIFSCGLSFDRAITQGAELMASFGVNVPPGKPAFNLEDVKSAIDAMADENGEVLASQTIEMIEIVQMPSDRIALHALIRHIAPVANNPCCTK